MTEGTPNDLAGLKCLKSLNVAMFGDSPGDQVVSMLTAGKTSGLVPEHLVTTGRAIADGGFTRLYHRWESAGTDGYINNAAAWLLNIERFDEGSFSAGG